MADFDFNNLMENPMLNMGLGLLSQKRNAPIGQGLLAGMQSANQQGLLSRQRKKDDLAEQQRLEQEKFFAGITPEDIPNVYQKMLNVPGLGTEALKGMTKERPKVTYQQDSEGNIVALPETMPPNGAITPTQTGVKGLVKGKEKPWYVDTDETGRPTGINPLFREFEFTKSQMGAPRTQITVDNKKQMSVVEPFLSKLPENYQTAIADKNSIDRVDKALSIVTKGGDSVTGLSGAIKSAVAPYATAIGMNTESMNDAQILKTLLDANAGSLRMEVVGPGPVSNYEQGILQRVSGSKMSAAEGVKKILEYHKTTKKSKLDAFNNQLDNASKIEGYGNIKDLYPTIDYSAPPADLNPGTARRTPRGGSMSPPAGPITHPGFPGFSIGGR